MTASASISREPKRELSKVTDMGTGSPSRVRSSEEVHEGGLDDARSSLQRRLVGGLLRVELDQHLGDVGVLRLGQLRERRLLDLGQAAQGRVETVLARAVEGAHAEQ